MSDTSDESDKTKPEDAPKADAETPVTEPKAGRRKRKSKTPRSSRPQKTKSKLGVGRGTVFAMMLLATVGGAIGGAVLSHVWDTQTSQSQNVVTQSEFAALQEDVAALPKPHEIDLDPILNRLEALEARTATSSENVSGDGNPVSPDIIARLEALEMNTGDGEAHNGPDHEARLATLEDRLQQGAESSDTSNVKAAALTSVTERLEALESALDETDVTARVEALETASKDKEDVSAILKERLDTLEASIAGIPEPVDVSAIEKRLKSLEKTTRKLKSTQAKVVKSTAPLPAFPSEAVLEALSKSDVDPDKGWIERTFDKYVLADNADAIAKVSNIETLLQQGRLDMALEQAQSLPKPGRTAAKDWIDTVSERLK